MTASGGTPTLTEMYLTGADGLRARWDPANFETDLYSYDPQGSLVQFQTSENANPANRTLVYDAWGYQAGNILYTKGTEQAPISPSGFGGQWGYYNDIETGLYQLGARYYDPGTGRFLTRDPIGYDGGINLYGFCGNNPVNESDPEGTSGSGSFWQQVYRFFFGTVKPGTASLGKSRGEEGLDADEMESGGVSQLVQHPAASAQKLNAGINETYVQAGMTEAGGVAGPEEELAASAEEAASTATRAYEVGTYKALKSRSRGTGLDIHHLPQANLGVGAISGYQKETGLSIALPREMHQNLPPTSRLKGDYSGLSMAAARRFISQQLRDLKNAGVPIDALRDLGARMRQTYPGINR